MIEVPLYPNGYPCKCSGAYGYPKAYESAGMPKHIEYEKYSTNTAKKQPFGVPE